MSARGFRVDRARPFSFTSPSSIIVDNLLANLCTGKPITLK